MCANAEPNHLAVAAGQLEWARNEHRVREAHQSEWGFSASIEVERNALLTSIAASLLVMAKQAQHPLIQVNPNAR